MSPVRDFGGALVELSRNITRKPDFYTGELIVLFGLVAALIKGPEYRVDTLTPMGPGFVSTALGMLLIFFGVFIAGTASGVPFGQDQSIPPEHRQRWGWPCVLAGPFSFIICGTFGFVPAAFTCVFVSALGDRTASWKSALALAAIATVFGIAVFSYLLQITMPPFRWGW